MKFTFLHKNISEEYTHTRIYKQQCTNTHLRVLRSPFQNFYSAVVKMKYLHNNPINGVPFTGRRSKIAVNTYVGQLTERYIKCTLRYISQFPPLLIDEKANKIYPGDRNWWSTMWSLMNALRPTRTDQIKAVGLMVIRVVPGGGADRKLGNWRTLIGRYR